MAVLPKNESRDEVRRRLIEEAEEYRRRHPVPPLEEVLAEIRPWQLPEGTPDSTTLIRAAREVEGLPPRFLSDSELRDRLIEAAAEYLRRDPNPRLKEVLAEIRSDRAPQTGEDRKR